jgi:serine phosphatase RsbU (regulator of sigma subunit)
MQPFTLHSCPVSDGDLIYIFSDGFADQFGGPGGKKFKYKPLKELLTVNSPQPMAVQKDILAKTFDDWRGNMPQIDDVLIIGIKV